MTTQSTYKQSLFGFNSPILWRKIHHWCGLGLAAFVIFYSLTGVLLNHRKQFDYFTTLDVSTTQVAPMETKGLQEILATGKRFIGRSDDPRVIRIPDGETIEFLYGSHGKTTYKLKPLTGIMETVQKRSIEPFSWLNKLHKASGSSWFWVLCADLVCIVALLLTMSGLVIVKYKLRDYLLLMGSVIVLFLGMFLS